MEPEIKKSWIKALRSGKYQQGRNALRKTTSDKNKDRFCCLGVLCDIIDKDKWEYCEIYYEWDTNSAYLPKHTAKLCDISSEEEKHLMRMNDNGHSFEEIADYIEKEI